MALSLSDLDAGSTTKPADIVDPLKTDIKSGDGGAQAAADLEAARQLNETKAAEKEAADKLIAEKLAAEGSTTKEEDDEPEGSIWDDVDALRGEKIDFKWEDEQGAIPEAEWDTPRGILARERAVEERAVVRFEETLMAEDPRGYEYLLHRKAGGTDEDFFAKKTVTLPDYERFKESVDLRVKVYADSLRAAGLAEKSIKHETDRAVKDKEIDELSEAAYKKQESDQQAAIKGLNQRLEQDRVYYERSVVGLRKALADQVASKDMMIVVPEAKRQEFLNFTQQHIQYDEGSRTFMFVQPIDPKTLPRQLEAMFLQFSGGDLGGLIQREAKSDNARRLRRKVDSAKEPLRTTADVASTRKVLGDL